jgi:amino acid permease
LKKKKKKKKKKIKWVILIFYILLFVYFLPYIRAYEHFEDLDVGFFFPYKAITS